MRNDHAKHSERRGGRLRSLVAVAAVLTTTLVALPAQPAAEASPTFTFQGGGFGHSVGMSQFGAYGMSRQGASWGDIMSHYFTGATPGDAHPSQVADPIWVNLTMEKTSITLTVFATGGPTNRTVVARLGGDTLKAAVGESLVLETTAAGCRVTAPAGTLEGACDIDLDWDGFDASPKVGLELAGCSLVNWNAPGGSRVQPCQYARGAVRVRPDNNTATMNLSLVIDIEDYVLGISEMPYAWGDTGGMAALQAQAVAARSYALHRAVLRGDAEDRPWCWCHLYDTTVDQHYVGWGHGTQNWLDAVSSTAGKVMHHPSATHAGNPLPIETFYSSSTFGWTENSEDGFITWVPYLRSVDDHWSQLPEVNNHSARWSRSFSGDQLASLLPGMSTVTGVEITECSATGAALELTFHGSGGPRAFETRTLRSTLSLKSMQIISIDGASPCSGPASQEPGGPAALAGITLDDDAGGDSSGDGDGIIECGETVEVWSSIVTEGGTITGVHMRLSSDDPHVKIAWNTTSTAPDAAPGSPVANDGDWDLAIASDAPDGHRALLDLRVDATNGGPWDLVLPIDIACGSAHQNPGKPRETKILDVMLPDLDGNGAPEIATALRNPRGRSRLLVTDTRTGQALSSIRLAGKRASVVDAASLQGTASGHGWVAVTLEVEGRDATRLVVVDALAGTTISKRGVAGSNVDVEAIGGTDGVAVATAKRGRTRALAFDIGSGKRIGRIGVVRRHTVIDLEVSGTIAAMLSESRAGAAIVDVFEAGRRIDRIRFGRRGEPVELEIVDGPPLGFEVTRVVGDRRITDVKDLG